ncbi:hypothetical protein [Gemmata sp.]|uniref:hypothetical protein n=1 Tax=Gemmata sp. TaxID=1914242 RepID=UPI003F6F78BB
MSPELPSEKVTAGVPAAPHASEDHDVDFTSRLRSLFSSLGQTVAEFQREQERRMEPIRAIIDQWMQLARAAHEIQPELISRLLGRGWYHSYYFTDSLMLALHGLFELGRMDEVDALMAEFARSQLDRIKCDLLRHFASRALIIEDAFSAHSAGKYTLSVPTLLAQADGIGREVLKTGWKGTFDKPDRKRSLAALLRVFELSEGGSLCDADSIYGRMLSPLTHDWSLTDPTNRPTGFLNRHGVLHGLHVDYPTEENSLRSVLLLGFLLDARKIIYEDLENRRAMITRLATEV